MGGGTTEGGGVAEMPGVPAREDGAPPPDLRSRILIASSRVVGAPERTEFLRLLAGARGYRLDAAATSALARTVSSGMADVEANVDLVPLDADGIWIEYPDAPRRAPGASPAPGTRFPCDVGVLVSVDPDCPDRFAIMSAWDFEPAASFAEGAAASVRHSYAAVALSRTDASNHAYAARTGQLDSAEAPFERLMGLANPYVPPGFMSELRLCAGVADASESEELGIRAMRDVMSEVPFALSALLLLFGLGRSGRGAEGDVSLPAPGTLGRLAARLRGPGFRSRGRPDPRRVRLSYTPPPETFAVDVRV